MLALIPEEAKGDDLFAAEAMAKFFISLHPGLYQTGDTALWKFLCLPNSVFCSSTVESATERVERGEFQTGGEVAFPPRFADTFLDLDDPDEPAYISFDAHQADLTVVDSNGTVLRSRGGYDFRVDMKLRYVDGLWRVHGVAVTET